MFYRRNCQKKKTRKVNCTLVAWRFLSFYHRRHSSSGKQKKMEWNAMLCKGRIFPPDLSASTTAIELSISSSNSSPFGWNFKWSINSECCPYWWHQVYLQWIIFEYFVWKGRRSNAMCSHHAYFFEAIWECDNVWFQVDWQCCECDIVLNNTPNFESSVHIVCACAWSFVSYFNSVYESISWRRKK